MLLDASYSQSSFVALLLLNSVVLGAGATVTVDNHRDGSEIRYSVALLSGTLSKDSKSLEITNANALNHHGSIRAVVHEGRFKALVELAEGKNPLILRDGEGEPLHFELNYRPQTNPYFVRLVWMTDNGGDTTFAAPTTKTPQDYEARLRTAGLLMQTFTAERMHAMGYGRRTFRLERDADGQVVVHTWRGSESRERYYELGDSNRWWNNVRVWLNREHPEPLAKNVVLAAYTRKDATTKKMKGHTALGGANLGLFGSASVFSWPSSISTAATIFEDPSTYDTSQVHDDSVGRSTIWGLASTTIGATLHETGHTFGLPHCRHPRGIMSRGFDYFNRCFTFYDPRSGRNRRPVYFAPKDEAMFCRESASYLRWSKWFRLDKKHGEASNRPVIDLDRTSGAVEIRCESGVPWVGFHLNGEVRAVREFDPENPPQKVQLTSDDIKGAIPGKFPDQIRVLSADGEVTATRLPKLE